MVAAEPEQRPSVEDDAAAPKRKAKAKSTRAASSASKRRESIEKYSSSYTNVASFPAAWWPLIKRTPSSFHVYVCCFNTEC